RWRACKELGIKPKTREWDGRGSLLAFVLSLNLHRRHLTPSQKAMAAAAAVAHFEKEARERMRAGGKKAGKGRPAAKGREIVPPPNGNGKARDQAAATLGVSARYVPDAKKVRAADRGVAEKVAAGELTLPRAKRAVARAAKALALEQKAAAALAEANGRQGWQIVCGDCVKELPKLRPGTFRTCFADS